MAMRIWGFWSMWRVTPAVSAFRGLFRLSPDFEVLTLYRGRL